MKKSIFGRIMEYFIDSSSAMAGRIRIFTRRWRSTFDPPANDWTRPDYPYWRKAFYGHIVGLRLSGLLIKPVCRKICEWTLGRAPTWTCENEATAKALNDWWGEHHSVILGAWVSALKQGDCVCVVNSDLSLTLLWPDFLDPIVAEDDFGNIIGWRITQTMDHPEDMRKMRVIDEYYTDRHIHRVEVNGIPTSSITYPNLIGRSQVVLISNHRDDGGVFGHPECEGMVPLLLRYGDVLEAAIEGNVLQGRPTPVIAFNNTNAQADFMQTYGVDREVQLEDGTTITERVADIDITKVITIVEGTFEFKSPGAFSIDVTAILQILYYLYLEHCEIPEFVLGSAVSSSKASTESQMPVFEKFIELFQAEMSAWLVELAEIVMAFQSLMMPGIVVEKPALQWTKLTQEGRLTLDTLTWALESGLIDRETALTLAPIEVENMEEVLDNAEKEKAERMAEQQEVFNQQQSAKFAAQRQNGGGDAPVARGPRSKSSTKELVDAEMERIVEEATAILEAA